MRPRPFLASSLLAVAGGGAQARAAATPRRLPKHRREAADATQHFQALEQEARRATSEADRARAASGRWRRGSRRPRPT